jgi:hypothetical protein
MEENMVNMPTLINQWINVVLKFLTVIEPIDEDAEPINCIAIGPTWAMISQVLCLSRWKPN